MDPERGQIRKIQVPTMVKETVLKRKKRGTAKKAPEATGQNNTNVHPGPEVAQVP